jgi:hypothetical protein
MTVALLNDLKAEVIFLPKSANTIFDNYFTYYLFILTICFLSLHYFPCRRETRRARHSLFDSLNTETKLFSPGW